MIFLSKKALIRWIEKSFEEYRRINWKKFNTRDKFIALSVKGSFLIDIRFNQKYNKEK